MRYVRWSLLVLVVAGFFASAGLAQPVNPGDLRVGVTLVTLADPFFASLREGLLERAEEVGLGTLTIEDGQGDAARQLSQVENFVAQGYDAIIINPVESQALVTAAEAAFNAGIPVFTMDRFIDAEYGPDGIVVAHMGADAVDGGRLGMQIIVDKLIERYGEARGQVLYIEGTPGSSTARDRTTGVELTLANYPNVQVIARQPGETRARALSLTENWLQTYPDADGIYAYGGDGALGAVQAAEAVGKLDQLIIVGTGAADDELAAIEEGRLDGTVDFNPVGTGRDAIDTVIAFLNGETVQEWVRTEAQKVTE